MFFDARTTTRAGPGFFDQIFAAKEVEVMSVQANANS